MPEDIEPTDDDLDEGLEVDLDDQPDDGDATGAEEYTPEQIAKIIAENQKVRKELKTSRERYRPIEEAFAGIPEDDAIALVGFARTLAGGNRRDAVNWLAENAVGLAGSDLVDVLRDHGWSKKDAVAAVKDAKEDAPTAATPGMTAEAIARMVEDRLAKERDENKKAAAWDDEVRGHVTEIDRTLADLDYTPDTPEAYDVIQEATRLLNTALDDGVEPEPVPALLKKAHNNLLKRGAARMQAERTRREKAGRGAPGPDGPAPTLGSGMKRVDVVAAKLEKDKLSRST